MHSKIYCWRRKIKAIDQTVNVKGQAFCKTVRKTVHLKASTSTIYHHYLEVQFICATANKMFTLRDFRTRTKNWPNLHPPSYCPDAHATSDEVKNLTEAPPDALLVARFNLQREFQPAGFRLVI